MRRWMIYRGTATSSMMGKSCGRAATCLWKRNSVLNERCRRVFNIEESEKSGSCMIDKVLSLLLLEDSPDDAKIIERELRKGTVPFRLTVVDSERNFRTALEKAEIDLVLSDYTLPGFSGFGALAICRPQGPA